MSIADPERPISGISAAAIIASVLPPRLRASRAMKPRVSRARPVLRSLSSHFIANARPWGFPVERRLCVGT